MSDISCDRSIEFKDFLSEDQMDKICMVEGPAPRISTQYTCHEWGKYVHLHPEEQGNFPMFKSNENKPNPPVPVGDLVKDLECTNENFLFFAKEDMPTRHHYVQTNRINDLLVKPADRWTAN